MFYVPTPSAFGTLNIIWRETAAGPRVYRVLLPNEQAPAQGSAPRACPAIADLRDRMQRFLAGDAVDFDLDLLALDTCYGFQRRVLLAEHGVPRGWVTTYGKLAAHLGVPGGARAVGNALARNPFPIVVPCHRAVRSDGHLGGFRGGLDMKRALLEMEGIEIAQTGKVLTDRLYY